MSDCSFVPLWKSAVFSTSGKPAWVFESVGKSPSPEDWGGSEHSLRGSAGCCHWCACTEGSPHLMRVTLSYDSGLRQPTAPAVEVSFSGSAEIVCSRWGGPQCSEQDSRGGMDMCNGTKLRWTCSCCSPNFSTGCMWNKQLTSALMSQLEFHVLNAAVSYLFIFSYIWSI